MEDSQDKDTFLLLSLVPLLSGILTLVTTTIFWYHAVNWTLKETLFKFSIPLLSFLAFLFILFLAFVFARISNQTRENQTAKP